jgi:hypothetical protein
MGSCGEGRVCQRTVGALKDAGLGPTTAAVHTFLALQSHRGGFRTLRSLFTQPFLQAQHLSPPPTSPSDPTLVARMSSPKRRMETDLHKLCVPLTVAMLSGRTLRDRDPES